MEKGDNTQVLGQENNSEAVISTPPVAPEPVTQAEPIITETEAEEPKEIKVPVAVSLDPTAQTEETKPKSEVENPAHLQTEAGSVQELPVVTENAALVKTDIGSSPGEPKDPAFSPSFKDQLREYMKANNAKSLKKQRERMAANLEKILAFAIEKGKVTNNDVERLTGVKDTRAVQYLNMLIKENKLARFGPNQHAYYKPVKQDGG